ncbi:MAG: HD-GYP domain-containing protein [Acetatifactor sp.]|nr:HD-GYP domain-containing protein [Acetatifactor sp.]
MKRLSTSQLTPGMVTAENVLSYNRQLIIPKGTELNDKLITKLALYGILMIFVEDSVPEEAKDQVPTSSFHDSYSQRIKRSEAFKRFKKDYDDNVDKFKDTLDQVIRKNIQLDVDILLENSLSFNTDLSGTVGILDMLQNMRDYDDSTFAHSMNVALICNILGHWIGMNEGDIKLLTACGLLHDIGKLLVPKEIITKPARLSEYEFNEVKKHPVLGYNLLRTQNINENIKYAALMHHERYDGSGYPMGIIGQQINKFARIVSIVDVYDAMTAARVYRGPQCPFRVIEIFEQEGYQKYDVQFLLPFLEHIVNNYLQNKCMLNDGRTGDIIFINKEHLSRPVVQCDDQPVDLSERWELSIEAII